MRIDAFAELELDDAQGTPRRLGDLFAERPTVVAFLRHYG